MKINDKLMMVLLTLLGSLVVLLAQPAPLSSQEVASPRDRLVNQVLRAESPAKVLAAWNKLVQIDSRGYGPLWKLPQTVKKVVVDVLRAFQAGKPESALRHLGVLRDSGVDVVENVLSAVEQWSFEWADAAIQKHIDRGDLSSATHVVAELTAAFGSDHLLLADCHEKIKAGQVQVKAGKVRELAESGKLALAYFAVDMVPELTAEERLELQALFEPRLEKMVDKLKFKYFIDGANPLSQTVAESLAQAGGEGFDFRYGRASAAEAYYPVQVQFELYDVEYSPPSESGTDWGTATYVVGTKIVDNPEKRNCEREVQELARELRSARRAAEMAERQAAANAAIMSSGFGGGIAGAVVAGLNKGVGVATSVAVGVAESKLENAEARCRNTESQITVDDTKDVSYEIKAISSSMKGRAAFVVLDAAHGRKQIARHIVDDEVVKTDNVIHGDPRMNIPNDDLDLPSESEIEAELRSNLVAKAKSALVDVGNAVWNETVADAEKMVGESRGEILARLLIWSELMGIPVPEGRKWIAEIGSILAGSSSVGRTE